MMHSAYSINDKNQNTETIVDPSKPYFFALQGSYPRLEIALFKDNHCLASEILEGKKASAELIPHMSSMLERNSLSLKNISFIALDQGPGAFTSLRVIIATANAISFSSSIRLIGIDGLDALAEEVAKEHQNLKNITHLAVLLNAYNNEVYYGIYSFQHNQIQKCEDKGYENYEILCHRMISKYPTAKFLCIGNGALLYQEAINSLLKKQSIFLNNIPSVVSALYIGHKGLESWKLNRNISTSLMPLYLKTQYFKPKYS